MTDKNKRLEKVLKKKGIKGWLKPVDNLENSQFVSAENKRCVYDSLLLRTEDYKTLLERGETYPPDIVHFLVNSNRRNVQNVNNSLLTPKLMSLSRVQISKLSPSMFGVHRIYTSPDILIRQG